MAVTQGEMLWSPPADARATSRVGRYLDWLAAERGIVLDDYDALFRWSVDDLDGFWASIWDFFGVRAPTPYERVLSERVMPGARWFEGATLNYAEHMVGADEDLGRVAVLGRSQTRGPVQLTFAGLREQVARARAGLERLGVGPGDRVVAYLPNIPETLVAFLATASLGAVWATCAPEFGARAVIDRFGIVRPKVLLAVAGYGYGAKHVDRRAEVAAIRAELASLAHVVHVPYAGGPDDALPRGAVLGGPARGARAAALRPGRLRPPALRPVLVGHDRPAQADRPRSRRHPRGLQEPRAELGPSAGRPDAARPVEHPPGRRRRLAAAGRGLRVGVRAAGPGHPAQLRLGRDRRLHRHRPGQPAAAGLRRGDRRPLPCRRHGRVRPGWQRGRRRSASS